MQSLVLQCGMKICTKCKVEKDVSEFRLRKGHPRSWCRACEKARDAEYKAENRELLRGKEAARRSEMGDGYAAYRREYYQQNCEKLSAKAVDAYWENRDKILARIATPEGRAVARRNMQAFRSAHEFDPAYQMVVAARKRMWHALHSHGKPAKTRELLGCSSEELVKHLENQFRDGMTWENWGTHWEVDHIRPCASFGLSDPNQVRVCFHFSNLQPLLRVENRQKGSLYLRKEK